MFNFKGGQSPMGHIDPSDIKSRTLEVAIPDRPLTQAQIQAFSNAQETAKNLGVSIIFTVVQ